jgi:hypothetical protein
MHACMHVVSFDTSMQLACGPSRYSKLSSTLIIIIMQVPRLYFVPSVPGINVDSGNNAVLQCILDGDSTHGGSFSWTGPAVTSGRANITLDTSRTVSTLTIDSVGRSDEGRYSCSLTGVVTISITLDVVCKLLAIIYRSRIHSLTVMDHLII